MYFSICLRMTWLHTLVRKSDFDNVLEKLLKYYKMQNLEQKKDISKEGHHL